MEKQSGEDDVREDDIREGRKPKGKNHAVARPNLIAIEFLGQSLWAIPTSKVDCPDVAR